jgi:hypothetical protein
MSFIGDLFKSGNSSSNTTDPQIKALLMGNYDQAQGVANMPFQPYTGERVAPFNPTQTAGQSGLINAANDPTGANTINSAASGISGLTGFKPQSVTAGQLSNTDLSPYMNPYTNDVINTTLGDLSHARDVQGVNDNAAATAAHAFGGTRQAVQNANTTNDYLRNVASTSAGLRQAGYQNAQQAAQFDIGNRLQVGQVNAGNDIAGANFRLNANNAYSNIGNEQLLDGLKRAGVIQAVGDQQQTQSQNVNNAAYEEFMRQIGYPKQQQDIRNSALGFLPHDNTQTTTDSPSPISSIGSVAKIASMFI